PRGRAWRGRGRSPGLPLCLRAGARTRSEPGRVRQRVPAAAALGRRAVDVHGRARARRVPHAAAGRGGREPCVRARAVPGERQAARARALSYFSNPGQTVVVQPALPLEEMTLPSAPVVRPPVGNFSCPHRFPDAEWSFTPVLSPARGR